MNHPMQPLERDAAGVIRFKANPIVRYLLDNGPHDLNGIAALVKAGLFSHDDYSQLMQLIGYSVSGYGDLVPLVSPASVAQADRRAAKMKEK